MFFECFYCCLPRSIWFFVKIFPHFYDQIKHKADNRLHPPTGNKKPMESLQTETNLKGCSVSGKSKFLSGLHTLLIRENSSGSVVFDIALYCAQYKHK